MFQRKGTRPIPYLSPFFLHPASHCPGSVIFLLVFKEKSDLFIGKFTWQVGHKKQKKTISSTIYRNQLFTSLKFTYTNTTFCKIDSNYVFCRESFVPAIFKAVSAWLCSFQNIMALFCNKTRYSYDFEVEVLAFSFNTKAPVTLCQNQLYNFLPSIQSLLT